MNTKVKKIIWIILGIVITGFIINSYMVNYAIKDAKKIDNIRKANAIKSSINDLVSFNGGLNNWEERLGKGEAYRLEPIMTLELEELWLQNRPILFIGYVKDIATYNETFYTLTVEREPFGSSDFEFSTELQLSLHASKYQINDLIKQHPNIFKDYDFYNNVAVIANIKAIKTSVLSVEYARERTVRIGEGELVDILYLGDINI